MKRFQGCIYKDFTCEYKYPIKHLHFYLQGKFTKILYKSNRLVNNSIFVQVADGQSNRHVPSWRRLRLRNPRVRPWTSGI